LLRTIISFYEPITLTNPLIRQFMELADRQETDRLQHLLLEEVEK